MIRQLCQSYLRLQHILLRHAADRIFDAGGSHGLARECDLLVVQSQLVLVAEKLVKRGAHLPRDFESLGFQLSFGDLDGLIRQLITQLAFA